jgi:hypothetical protein
MIEVTRSVLGLGVQGQARRCKARKRSSPNVLRLSSILPAAKMRALLSRGFVAACQIVMIA